MCASVLLSLIIFLSGCGPKKRVSPHPYGGSSSFSRLSNADRLRLRVLLEADSLIGTPYVWGGESPEGFDCSGLVYYCYLKQGVKLPRTTAGQKHVGRKVSRNRLKIGDLVLFKTGPRGGYHVGLYAGGDTFIHAPKRGKTVERQSLDSSYYQKHFHSARRVI